MLRTIVATILLASTGLPFSSQAETFNTCTGFIDAVPAVISTQGVYCLRKDVVTTQTNGEAIAVTANNVTLDCNGYKIGGLGAGPDTLTRGVIAQADNFTIRHCSIRGFRNGVSVFGDGIRIEDNNFDQNTSVGISIFSSGGVIRNNRVMDTGLGTTQAIGIIASSTLDIRDNTVDGVDGAPVYGIQLLNASVASISNNSVRNLTPSGTASKIAFGIAVLGTSNHVFIDSNRVSLPAASAGSMGYRCDSLQGAVRGSSSWGFEIPISAGCRDSGGNLAY